PTDDATRLVYADWLEERGDPVSLTKAEFLRLTAQLATNPGTKAQRKAKRKRLQELAADLDTDWLAVVSRLPVENCRKKAGSRHALAMVF
ncbi:TIGR02996 domain-containing protein, partial [Klebsiella pneumoniae]|uniref:TIGR02996 domain-containing protein n=1 Tax=Klebsiella pneumoniae TaxID=573 RepID=UPI0030137FBE